MKLLFASNRRFIHYCVIGATGVTLDFSIYSLLLKSQWFNCHYQAANAIGYASGTLLSFFLNAHFNFKTRDWLALRLASFCAVAALGYAASAGSLQILIAELDWDKRLSKLATLVLVLALQYNLNRAISFRKSPAPGA